MLQKLEKQLAEEGKRDDELYGKYQCYCKGSNGDLQASISSSTANIGAAEAAITELTSAIAQLKADIKQAEQDRADAKASMATATAIQDKSAADAAGRAAELKGFIDALTKAIAAISKGMAGGASFLQSDATARTALRQAVVSAAMVSDEDRQLVLSFLAGSAYDAAPQSGEILGVLQQLLDEFTKDLSDLKAEAAAALANYNELMAAKTREVKVAGARIEAKSVAAGEKALQLEQTKNDLSQSQRDLLADKQYLAELETGCGVKAKEYEERKKTRAEELLAIRETVKVLNDDDALELFKKVLPSPSLIQVQSTARQALALLKAAKSPGIGLIALKLEGRAVDFTAVLGMIDDMVKVLDKEDAEDLSKKELCQKQIDEQEDAQKQSALSIDGLKQRLGDAKDQAEAIQAEIASLGDEVAKLDKETAEASAARKAENAAFQQALAESAAAVKLLNFAKNRLNKLYNAKLYIAPAERTLTREEQISGIVAPEKEAGGIAGTGISVSLLQVAKGRAAQPETWGSYEKKSAETTGVINLMDMLIRDLTKDMVESKTQEADAQTAYEQLTASAAASRAGKTAQLTSRTQALAEANALISDLDGSVKTELGAEMAGARVLASLHGSCDWLLQNFDLRRDAREEERQALKTAKAVLSGASFAPAM